MYWLPGAEGVGQTLMDGRLVTEIAAPLECEVAVVLFWPRKQFKSWLPDTFWYAIVSEPMLMKPALARTLASETVMVVSESVIDAAKVAVVVFVTPV